MGTARRSAAAAVAAVAALAAVAGCGSTRITAPALQASVAGTFAHLYVLQQSEQGHPRPDLVELQSTASCQKGSAATEQSGAGNDWICQVTYLVDGPSTPVRALYTVDVHTDGCWSADGDGPASVNGSRTIVNTSGASVPNPLHLVDGCFDAG